MKNLGLILGGAVGVFLLWKSTQSDDKTTNEEWTDFDRTRLAELETRQAAMEANVDSLGSTKADNAALEEVEEAVDGLIDVDTQTGLDLETYTTKSDANESALSDLQDSVSTFESGLAGKQDSGNYVDDSELTGIQNSVDAIALDLDGFDTSYTSALDNILLDVGNFQTSLDNKQDAGNYATEEWITGQGYASSADLDALDSRLGDVETEVGIEVEIGGEEFAGNGFAGSIWN